MRELSLNVLDVAQNSISASATLIKICLIENFKLDYTVIKIIDNGKGMTESQLESVIDPFYTTRTNRKVGLGVPFFKMAAEMTGGEFKINSYVGKGTNIYAKFINSSIDMTPVGDINSTVSLLIRCNPSLDFIFERQINDKSFILDTREIKKVLDEDVSIDNSEITIWINNFLNENLNNILKSK